MSILRTIFTKIRMAVAILLLAAVVVYFAAAVAVVLGVASLVIGLFVVAGSLFSGRPGA